MFIFIFATWTFFGSALCICDPGWDEYNNTCYFFSRDIESFSAAQIICRDILDSNLAEVEDEQENHFLATKARLHANAPYRIGLADFVIEGLWLWVISGMLPGNFNWRYEPNRQWGANCVVIESDGYWHDNRCNVFTHFICERKQNQFEFTIVG